MWLVSKADKAEFGVAGLPGWRGGAKITWTTPPEVLSHSGPSPRVTYLQKFNVVYSNPHGQHPRPRVREYSVGRDLSADSQTRQSPYKACDRASGHIWACGGMPYLEREVRYGT